MSKQAQFRSFSGFLSANPVTADLPGRSDDEVGNFSASSLSLISQCSERSFDCDRDRLHSTNSASARTIRSAFSFVLAIIFFSSLINESLVTVFHSHLRHIEQAVRSERLKKTDPKFVQRNAAFLLDTLLSLVSKRSSPVIMYTCTHLSQVQRI